MYHKNARKGNKILKLFYNLAVLMMVAALIAGCGQEKPAPGPVVMEKPQTSGGQAPAVDHDRAARNLPRPPKNMAYSIGEKMPEFTLSDLNGKQRRSVELFSGSRITVLNFWGTF